jgi:hypothetical protein
MSDQTTGESGPAEVEEPPSRVAGGCVLLVLAGVVVLVLRVVVTVAPYSAYFVAGVLVCLGWQRVAGWLRRRRENREEAADQEEPDVVEALQHLGRNGDHVLLTQLRKRCGAADTKAVRKLLKAEKIRVRGGVRTPAGNGPGVHQDDIPAPPLVEAAPSESGCSCRPGPTTPTPTTTGTTVEPIGLAGMVVKDGSEAARQHHV